MDKRFWIILGIVAAIFVGFLFLRGGDEAKAPSNGDTNQVTNHVLGNAESDVVLIEYTDFQCPFCAAFNPTVKQVVEKYKNDIAFHMRHLPLPTHQNGRAAGRAAEAAGNQGKFFEMGDLLFANQSAWSESNNALSLFEQYAQQLNLNVEQFKNDFGSSTVNDRINADVAEFNKTGSTVSTPAFFLNGERLQLQTGDLAEFSKYIDEALKEADSQ